MPTKNTPPYIGEHDQKITATIDAPKVNEVSFVTHETTCAKPTKKRNSKKNAVIQIVRESRVVQFD